MYVCMYVCINKHTYACMYKRNNKVRRSMIQKIPTRTIECLYITLFPAMFGKLFLSKIHYLDW